VSPPPRIWLLLADKTGDNAQVEAIANELEARLGWPAELKRLVVRPEWAVAKPKVRPRTDHVDLERSDPLAPPWPDLILTVGRRPSSVALWLRERSHGKSKIVLVGKPSSAIGRYDLVIGSVENQMPDLPNVLQVALPLMRVDRAAVEAAAGAWRQRLAALPRPLVAILMGGPTGPFVYDGRVVTAILDTARKIAAEGGTPWIVTSRRTPAPVVEAIAAGLPAAARLTRWLPDLAPDENPYRALLGLADGCIVTGDSVSMIVEVARLGRPLQVLPLPTSRLGGLDLRRRDLARRVFGGPRGRPGRLGRLLYRLRLVTQTRSFEALYDLLERQGLATPLGTPFAPPRGEIPDDLGRVVERIAALLPAQAEPPRT
jgi:mitochondrial fission protein ELM1